MVESDYDLSIAEINDDSADPKSEWWIKDLGLHESDRCALMSGSELTDSIVNAAQKILANQFPVFHGFQSTILIHHLNFQEIPSTGSETVQILHTGMYVLDYFVCYYRGRKV